LGRVARAENMVELLLFTRTDVAAKEVVNHNKGRLRAAQW